MLRNKGLPDRLLRSEESLNIIRVMRLILIDKRGTTDQNQNGYEKEPNRSQGFENRTLPLCA